MKTIQHIKQLHIFTGLLLICLFSITMVQAQDPSREEIIEAVMVFSKPETIQQLDSPDGTFTAEVTVYPCVEISGQETSYEQMNLIDNSTGESQQIAEQLINCGGLGAFGLWAMRWSDDSSYLYYTDEREGTPDGLALGWTSSVSRIQMTDLQTERLGQAEFSPNGKWLAVRNQGQIQLLSLASAEVTSFLLSPSDLQIVEIVWLPDNSGIIYIQADEPFGMISRSTVTHFDLTTGTQTVLLDRES